MDTNGSRSDIGGNAEIDIPVCEPLQTGDITSEQLLRKSNKTKTNRKFVQKPISEGKKTHYRESL